MTRRRVLLWIFIMLASPAVAGDIDKLLAVPEERIDVGIAALTLAKEFYPNLDIPAYSQRLDQLAQQVRWLTGDSTDPETRIRALNTVLHLHERFRYDHSPSARGKRENYFLNGILDTHLGTCVTMPLLYVAVGQREGYPIYPVLAPDHMFVRYGDPSFAFQNIETTSGGKYLPDEHYIKRFAVSERGIKSGSYLKSLSYRQYLGVLLAANAVTYGRNGNGGKSKTYLEQAMRINPNHADNYDNMRITYEAFASVAMGERAEMYQALARRAAVRAKELGFVDPDIVKATNKNVIRGK